MKSVMKSSDVLTKAESVSKENNILRKWKAPEIVDLKLKETNANNIFGLDGGSSFGTSAVS